MHLKVNVLGAILFLLAMASSRLEISACAAPLQTSPRAPCCTGGVELPLKRRTLRFQYFTMCREWHAPLLLSLSCWLGLSTQRPSGIPSSLHHDLTLQLSANSDPHHACTARILPPFPGALRDFSMSWREIWLAARALPAMGLPLLCPCWSALSEHSFASWPTHSRLSNQVLHLALIFVWVLGIGVSGGGGHHPSSIAHPLIWNRSVGSRQCCEESI